MENNQRTFYPTEVNVKHISRTLIRDNTAWLIQSGSGIEFFFKGLDLELTVIGDGSENSEEDLRPRIAILIDDKVKYDLMINEPEKKIKIIEDGPISSIIKIIKLSEEKYGSFGIKEMKIKSEESLPLTPTENKKFKIEFIGDSITCGYGVEAGSEDKFSTKTENFMKTYAYLISKELDYDYYTVSYSGYGVVSGSVYNPDGPELSKLIPPIYSLIGKIKGFNDSWDFDKHKVDLILINLGTNDLIYIAYPGVNSEPRYNSFVEKYTEFLGLVRLKNPNTPIICTYGMMGGHELFPYLVKAINIYIKNSGDQNVFYFLSPDIDKNDGFGALEHPNCITQEKNCKFIVEKFKELNLI